MLLSGSLLSPFLSDTQPITPRIPLEALFLQLLTTVLKKVMSTELASEKGNSWEYRDLGFSLEESDFSLEESRSSMEGSMDAERELPTAR